MARNWSQQELADRTGLSRAGVSAIETGRLAPAVTTALALGEALGCSVEELFNSSADSFQPTEWAFPPGFKRRRYWKARVGNRLMAYPVEADSPQLFWHDGTVQDGTLMDRTLEFADQTLVVACCDPASAMLAAEYSRQFRFRMIVLRRSSREALRLLAAGVIHVAGAHLGRIGRQSENAQAARSLVGRDCRLVRVARWEEGVTIAHRIKATTIEGLLRSRARWIGREEGSGARQCQDQILGDRITPRRIACDHTGVVAAVKSGWADAGPCVRLASEEAGLVFLKVRQEDYDLCFSARDESDPRLTALVATLRSKAYRSLLADLPGYLARSTGEMQ